MTDTAIDMRSTRLGMGLCLTALFIFALQDSITKSLIDEYHATQMVMVRYWVFAAAIALYAASRGQLRRRLGSSRPVLQIIRSGLLVAEMAIFAAGLAYLGLAEMHSLFATFPLIVTALAAVLLHEHIGWYRRMAVLVGFLGALLIIKPGLDVFQPAAFIGLGCALMFAFYTIITRFVSQHDDTLTSLLYMGIIGALMVTPFGIANWTPPDAKAWSLFGLLSVTGLCGHVLLVKALQYAPAASLQPLNYFLIAFAMMFGIGFFGERPDLLTIAGAVVIVGSGLFAMFRERIRKQSITGIEPESIRH